MNCKISYPENLYRAVYGHSMSSKVSKDDIGYSIQKGCNLLSLMHILTPREHTLITFYFKGCRTYKAVAEEYNISEERIRRIIDKGLRRLRRLSDLIQNGFEASINNNRYAGSYVYDTEREPFESTVSYEYKWLYTGMPLSAIIEMKNRALIEKTETGYVVHADYIPNLKIYTEALIDALDK